jgi:hypothetical protein
LLLSVLLLLPALSASAAPALFYPSGTLSFSYSQLPFGPISGSYEASGSLLDLDSFPAGPAACAAASMTYHGTTYLLVLSGRQNPDSSVDAAFVWLAKPAIMAGSYPLDLTSYTALFGYLEGATGVDWPTGNRFHETNWTEWLELVTARNTWVGASGGVTLLAVDPSRLEGIFQVIAVDPEPPMSIMIPDGFFSFGATVSVDDASWGSIKAGYAE